MHYKKPPLCAPHPRRSDFSHAGGSPGQPDAKSQDGGTRMAPLAPSVPRGGRTRGTAEQGPLQGLYPRGPHATASLSDVTRVSLRKCPAVPRRWSGGHALHWRLAVRNHLKTRGDCQLTSDGGSFPRELIPSGGGKSGREGGGRTGPLAHEEGPETHAHTGTHTCKHLHTHACTAHPLNSPASTYHGVLFR